MNPAELQEIKQKTTYTIPTAEAESEVCSREMWKPKPIKIPKNSVQAVSYQITLATTAFRLQHLPIQERLLMKIQMVKLALYAEAIKRARTECRRIFLEDKKAGCDVRYEKAKEIENKWSGKYADILKQYPGLNHITPERADLVLANWSKLCKTIKIQVL